MAILSPLHSTLQLSSNNGPSRTVEFMRTLHRKYQLQLEALFNGGPKRSLGKGLQFRRE
jgi:hypothetical protein